GTVEIAEVGFGVHPELENRLGQLAPVGLQLGDDAEGFLPALPTVLLTEQDVTPATQAVRHWDDGLAALFVPSVAQNVRTFGHAVHPFLGTTSARLRVRGRAVHRGQVRLSRVRPSVHSIGPTRIRTWNQGIMSPIRSLSTCFRGCPPTPVFQGKPRFPIPLS